MRSFTAVRASAGSAATSAKLAASRRASTAVYAQRREAQRSIAVLSRSPSSFVAVGGGAPLRSTPTPLTSSSSVSVRSSSPDASADELAGQITAELMDSMRLKIAAALETDPALVRVGDASGDGRHVEIDVVAAAFEGKKSMERQRMVYKAIWQELAETVHAVDAMTTKTPAEAGK